MSRRRIGKPSEDGCYPKQLRSAIRRFLPARGLPLQVPNGKVCWTPRLLVMGAILMSWDKAQTLKDRFESMRQALVQMYPGRKRPGGTYEGFVAALAGASGRMLDQICLCLRQAVQEVAGDYWEYAGWVLFGADGSKVECPMTEANEDGFGCAGKKKATPQQFITTLYHLSTGLVWAWKRGPARSSERGHLLDMLCWLPKRAMLLADAGFTGYQLLKTLMQQGHGFIIRVGSNVRLLTKLGYAMREYEGIVYLWPQNKQGLKDKKGRWRGPTQDPLVLRLIVLQGGRQPVYLLTNVLDKAMLPDQLAGKMYRLRWGIELHYRSLKQTLSRRKLLSDCPRHAEVELDWCVVGLWLLGLMSVSQIIESGQCPHCWSVASALRVVRRGMCWGNGRCRRGRLQAELRAAVKDKYQRHGSKKARHWPHKKTEKPPGAPKIRVANELEVQQAQELRRRKTAA